MYNTDEKRRFSELAKNRLCSHAYIVDGDAGIGKLDFALYCAQALLCGEANPPCGYCLQCRKAINGDHPDIFIIGKEKTPSIDDVRELIRRSSLKPNDGERQVFIVCNGGKLRAEAQNALLKIFEEPPKSVSIFLLTESRSSLLPTVLSRGQSIHLDGVSPKELTELLAKKYSDLGSESISRAVCLAQGNYGKAKKLLSKENLALREKVEKLLLLAFSGDKYGVSSMLIAPKYKRHQLLPLMEAVAGYVTELQKQKYGVRNAFITANGKLLSANKRVLAHIAAAAFEAVMALEDNGNANAVAARFTIELLRSVKK